MNNTKQFALEPLVAVVMVLCLFTFTSVLSQENLISNGEFDDGTTGWWIGFQNTATGISVIDDGAYLSDDNSLRVDIENGGQSDYDILMNQQMTLEEGETYDIFFMATSSEGALIRVSFNEIADPWNPYKKWAFRIGDDDNVDFGPYKWTCNNDDGVFEVRFWLGGAEKQNMSIWLDAVQVVVHQEVGIENHELSSDRVVDQFRLEKNYPNPFNPETQIRYNIPEKSFVNLTVYTVLGEKVQTLINGYQDAGVYHAFWNGLDENKHNVPSGLYLYRIQASGSHHSFSQTQKMLLVR